MSAGSPTSASTTPPRPRWVIRPRYDELPLRASRGIRSPPRAGAGGGERWKRSEPAHQTDALAGLFATDVVELAREGPAGQAWAESAAVEVPPDGVDHDRDSGVPVVLRIGRRVVG